MRFLHSPVHTVSSFAPDGQESHCPKAAGGLSHLNVNNAIIFLGRLLETGEVGHVSSLLKLFCYIYYIQYNLK